MTVCPICDNAQSAGELCDVCGTLLATAGVAEGLSPGDGRAELEGLEPTHFGAVEVSADGVEGLEPTAHGPVDVDAEPPLELERTAADPVDVSTEATPGLERVGDDVPDDGPTAVPFVVTCRYCREPALPDERVCSHCGMRLPAFDTRPAMLAAVARRCGCGAPVHGILCPACGARGSAGA
jgi:hypothetical protein